LLGLELKRIAAPAGERKDANSAEEARRANAAPARLAFLVILMKSKMRGGRSPSAFATW
jgi:hypothetical protein